MRKILSAEIHFRLYLFALILTAVSLPLSRYLLSVSLFFMALVWIAEWNFKEKLQRLYQSKGLLVFIIIYFTHIVWLLNSADFDRGLHDIRVKLPIFVFSVLIATSPKISLNHLKIYSA